MQKYFIKKCNTLGKIKKNPKKKVFHVGSCTVFTVRYNHIMIQADIVNVGLLDSAQVEHTCLAVGQPYKL